MQIEAAFHKVIGESVEQFRVRGRVRQSSIVDGLDQASSGEISPRAVRDVACKPLVLRIRQPVGEENSPVAFRSCFRRGLQQCVSLHDFAAPRVLRRRLICGEQKLVSADGLKRDLCEERLHSEVVALSPTIKRVVVALSTLDADTEQNLRERRRDIAWLLHHFVKVASGTV